MCRKRIRDPHTVAMNCSKSPFPSILCKHGWFDLNFYSFLVLKQFVVSWLWFPQWTSVTVVYEAVSVAYMWRCRKVFTRAAVRIHAWVMWYTCHGCRCCVPQSCVKEVSAIFIIFLSSLFLSFYCLILFRFLTFSLYYLFLSYSHAS